MGVDDQGNAFELSPDPLLVSLKPYVEGFRLGNVDAEQIKKTLLPLLKNKQIFGVDLEEAGMSEEVLKIFGQLLSGEGAVRSTLHQYAD